MGRSNNLPAKKYKAGERTERTLVFKWDAGDGESTNTKYIDLAQSLSIANRRHYRQGLYYYVQSAYFVNGSEAHCQINTIPDNWQTARAWARGFRKFQKMNALAANGSGGAVYPKYHDFKVRMTSSVTSATTMTPAYGSVDSSTAYASDEWVYSKFVTADPGTTDPQEVDAFTAHMLGGHDTGAGTGSSSNPDNFDSIGLIRSLGDTWPYSVSSSGEPTHDADFDTDPLGNLFDAGDNMDDVRLNLDQDNDLPPYDRDTMTGATSHAEGSIVATFRTSSGAGAMIQSPGFCAPLGLLQVQTADFGASTSVGQVTLVLEMAPGPYHGVYAERVH